MDKHFQPELPLFFRREPQTAGQPRHILLGARIVDYRLVRARRRSLGMTIDQRGLRVSAALRTSQAEIEDFLRQHAAWVLKKLDEWRGEGEPTRLAVRDGARIPLLGGHCTLRIEPGANRAFWQEDSLVLQARPGADLRLLARQALRERALALFRQRVAHFAAELALPPPAVALSSAQTRWGSCSAKGGIRLSWRLLHAAPALVDYVVAHEVAHLVEMNHSPRFWRLVERLHADCHVARAELRRFAITCPVL
ncbi:MAG TPA: SprT family zinc-dependent metalloprotease [Candidatus Desulfobacillus sp.]|nr:SprT family zinc-dependent metalloprotease [Candidatus Desulfobacillus sp.]